MQIKYLKKKKKNPSQDLLNSWDIYHKMNGLVLNLILFILLTPKDSANFSGKKLLCCCRCALTSPTKNRSPHTHTKSSATAAVFLKDSYSCGATCDHYTEPKTDPPYS